MPLQLHIFLTQHRLFLGRLQQPMDEDRKKGKKRVREEGREGGREGGVGSREKRKEETRKGRQERGLRVPGETSWSDAPRSTTGSAAGFDSVACIAASTAAAQVTSPSTVSKNTRVERGEWVSGTYHAA